MMNRLVVSLVVDGPGCFHGEQYACQSTWLMHATLLCLVLEDAIVVKGGHTRMPSIQKPKRYLDRHHIRALERARGKEETAD